MKTKRNLGSRLKNRIAQGNGKQTEFIKYIVIRWNGKEQVVSLPFEAKHADVFRYLQQESGAEVEAVSGGFFYCGAGAFWAGGESTSLNLQSRPQDKELIQVGSLGT